MSEVVGIYLEREGSKMNTERFFWAFVKRNMQVSFISICLLVMAVQGFS